MSISKTAKIYCRDDLQKIENYDAAMKDTDRVWHCHHRLEFTLNGEPAVSSADLKRFGMYYNRPHYELIFLHPGEHVKIHCPRSAMFDPRAPRPVCITVDEKYEDILLYIKYTTGLKAWFERCLSEVEIPTKE